MRFESPSTGNFREIVSKPVSHGTVRPIRSSVDLDMHIETGDAVYTCLVTAQENGFKPIDNDKVQVILEQYRDVFPDELHAGLPPKRPMPLKDSNAVPPALKSYSLLVIGMTCCQCLRLLSTTHIKRVSKTPHSMQTMASVLASQDSLGPDDIVREGKLSRNPQAYSFIGNIEKTTDKAKSALSMRITVRKKHYDARHQELQFSVGNKVWLSSKILPLLP